MQLKTVSYVYKNNLMNAASVKPNYEWLMKNVLYQSFVNDGWTQSKKSCFLKQIEDVDVLAN